VETNKQNKSRNVFLTFLGTGKYDNVTYRKSDKHFESEKNKYIQIALLEYFKQQQITIEAGYIFLTKDALLKNWDDDNALKAKLEEKEYRNITPVVISEAVESNRIWDIFEIITAGNKENKIDGIEGEYAGLVENDNIYLDITHSFRSIPMLALVALQYAKVLKNIKIKGIFYGSEPQNGKAEIIDLTSLAELMDWTNAVNSFLKYGQAIELKEIAKHKNSNEKFKPVVDKIAELCELIQTARGKMLTISEEIEGYFDFTSLREELIKYQKDDKIPNPFRQIIKPLLNKLEYFRMGEVKNGYLAVGWCIDHQLFQQAYTLLQETIITDVLWTLYDEIEVPYNTKSNSDNKPVTIYREDLADILGKIGNQKLKCDSQDLQDCKEKIEKDPRLKALAKLFIELRKLRNDFNHGGYEPKAASAKKLIKTINDLYQQLKEINKSIV
jgi:CRISPR-associated Csx2 family protein